MKRCEVVEANWPYSDLSGTKVRPAVIVQADFLNGLVDDTILVKVTGIRFGIPNTEVLLDPAVETGAGLSKVCYASCKDILTRDQAVLGPVIGYVSDSAMQQIEACLKAVLEKCLSALVAVLGRLLVRLYLTARHERLDREPYLQDGPYRRGAAAAPRTLKTASGAVTYGRTQLIPRCAGAGFYPLDAVLGLTRDKLSPWVMPFVGRLATRMRFAASRLIGQAALRWSPATAAELAHRRGPRRPRCGCGCQRHRGQTQRPARGAKTRRKKGDHSKNGKEVVLVVMYTLRRAEDGTWHGPCHKKVWASFAGRKVAAGWARAEATKRGFGPDTTTTVPLVMDGAKGLRQNLEPLFSRAIVTLDVGHVVEKFWALGHRFQKEGSAALTAWVAELKTLLYGGQAAARVERLRGYQRHVPDHGPGTKGRRQGLKALIGYLTPRLEMRRYAEWRAQDLVIGSGQGEGAARHVVGERRACAGRRWLPGKGEALVQLRGRELNGDGEQFVAWV